LPLSLEKVVRAAAWAACPVVLAMLVLFLVSDVGQDPLQSVLSSSAYASLLVRNPAALRMTLASTISSSSVLPEAHVLNLNEAAQEQLSWLTPTDTTVRAAQLGASSKPSGGSTGRAATGPGRCGCWPASKP
jgi:hypothetical protein